MSRNDNSTDYEIKMDGEQHQYASGAVRYNKDKGNFNLIPQDVVQHMLDYILGIDDVITYTYEMYLMCTVSDLFSHAYERCIVDIIIKQYLGFDGAEDAKDPQSFSRASILGGFIQMLRDLAIHYQKGAKKYGVDNWRKGVETGDGIPITSFFDSGVRHTLQFLNGDTDEPHHISAIWNFFCAIYVQNHSHQ